MNGKTGPVWICEFKNKPSVYAEAPRPAGAAAECVSAGLGTPTAVNYAGYVASPDPPPAPRPKMAIPPPPAEPEQSGRRAELVLTLYGLLRCDWPLGSILKPFDAAARLPSQSALRDFVANVGSAIERTRHDSLLVNQVIESQSDAWIAAAKEHNARRLGKWKEAEVEAERKIRNRNNAKRLRKRVDYQKAIGELAKAIDGLLPEQEDAVENFRGILADSGLGSDDIESIVGRYRRISTPRM